MLYARMWCNILVSDAVARTCEHGPPPHEILVCIVQKDNARALFKHLRDLAGSRRPSRLGAHASFPCCDQRQAVAASPCLAFWTYQGNTARVRV
jgi:hypothetical protein